MNRTFHARITWYQYFYLILLGLLAFYLLWAKAIVIAIPCMLLLVFLIEKFIHTTYTITADGKLIVCHGRFSKGKIIDINRIHSVESRQSAKFGKYAVARYVLIGYGADKFVSVLPVKEKEFLNLLQGKIDN